MKQFYSLFKNTVGILCFFVLFASIFNIFACVLLQTLFIFLNYPSFPASFSNPFYVLFPATFLFFSLPSLITLSYHPTFSYKKRFLLLLESHAFTFFIQILFWVLFCLFTLHYASDFLELVIGSSGSTGGSVNASLSAIFVPLVLSKLLPVFAMFFIAMAFKSSLSILNDEEKQEANQNNVFVFSQDYEIGTPHEIQKGLIFLEYTNIFLLLIILILFIPVNTIIHSINFLPKLSQDTVLFLVCYLQYNLVKLYKNEKRIQFLYYGITLHTLFYAYALYSEELLWQSIFTGYFAVQIYASSLLFKKRKQYFR